MCRERPDFHLCGQARDRYRLEQRFELCTDLERQRMDAGRLNDRVRRYRQFNFLSLRVRVRVRMGRLCRLPSFRERRLLIRQ